MVRVSFLVRALVVLLLLVVPLRIVARGYFPDDDALRHAAKAVSGRPWTETLVLRPQVTMDSHPGWHAALGLVHRATGAGPHALVVVSMVVGLLALLLPPALLLRRPEAWAAALLALGVLDPRILTRFASGRPFLLSAGLLAVLCVLAPRAATGVTLGRALVLLGPAFAVVAWMHPSWHLFLMPVAACLLAGERRTAVVLAAALALGVALAGLLHGNPVEFIQQSLLHTVLAMGSPAPPGTLAVEFLPGDGSPLLLLGAAVLWTWRGRRPEPVSRGARAVLALAVLGWLLGFLVVRSWSDWGAVALLVFMALEIERALEERSPADDRRRLAAALVAGASVILAWSAPLRPTPLADRPFLALAAPTDPALLPEPGGVLYTDDMRVFYQLFYARPDARWRYIVGYEPALMPKEDLATFRSILAARTPSNFEPWVLKMRGEDRMVIRSLEGQPGIPGLAWTPISRTLWSGRVERAAR